MPLIELATLIEAPVERCFDLSCSIDLHLKTGTLHMERVISGRRSGLIELDETVEWEARPFGLPLTHKSLVDQYKRPSFFSDTMVAGWFKNFRHEHHFESNANGTVLRDKLTFEAPFALLNWPAKRYLTMFLKERNSAIKQAAETSDWNQYLS